MKLRSPLPPPHPPPPGANVRVMRGDAIMYDGKLKTLKHFKEDVSTLDSGNECGISFVDWEEMEDGMIVECYVE